MQGGLQAAASRAGGCLEASMDPASRVFKCPSGSRHAAAPCRCEPSVCQGSIHEQIERAAKLSAILQAWRCSHAQHVRQPWLMSAHLSAGAPPGAGSPAGDNTAAGSAPAAAAAAAAPPGAARQATARCPAAAAAAAALAVAVVAAAPAAAVFAVCWAQGLLALAAGTWPGLAGSGCWCPAAGSAGPSAPVAQPSISAAGRSCILPGKQGCIRRVQGRRAQARASCRAAPGDGKHQVAGRAGAVVRGSLPSQCYAQRAPAAARRTWGMAEAGPAARASTTWQARW